MILRAAAQVIERFGWHQGGLGNTWDGFCLVGALQYVSTEIECGSDTAHRAYIALGSNLGAKPERWNDWICPSKERAVLVLRQTADMIDRQRAAYERPALSAWRVGIVTEPAPVPVNLPAQAAPQPDLVHA